MQGVGPPEISDEELVALYAGRGIDRDSAPFFRGWLASELRLNRCADCSTWHHPPRPLCPACWSTDVRPMAVSGAGTIHLLVLLHQGPPAPGVTYDPPYPVVTVELDEQPGLRFTSSVVGSALGDLEIGRRVTLAWVERAGAPFPVFRLEVGPGE